MCAGKRRAAEEQRVAVRLPGWGRHAPAKPATQGAPPPDFIGPFAPKPGASSAPPSACVCEAYRERIEQCHGHLARPDVGPRLYRRPPGGEVLCSEASRTTASGNSQHHPHRTRTRGPGRRQQRPDGTRSAEGQVSPRRGVLALGYSRKSVAGQWPELRYSERFSGTFLYRKAQCCCVSK